MPIKGPNSIMKKRIGSLMLILVVFGFGAVAVRLFYMQVINTKFYQDKAYQLQTDDTLITPKRGAIYDRNMKEIAVSAGTEMVTVDPRQLAQAPQIGKDEGKISKQQYQQEAAQIVAEHLELSYEKVLAMMQKDANYVVVKKGVEKDAVESMKAALKAAGRSTGIHTDPDNKRYYPYGSFASQMVGFMSDGKGALGIEAQYEEVLRGTAGRVVRAKNGAGGDLPIDYEQYIPPTDGGSVVLTIDEAVQHFLEKNLETAFADNPLARGGVSGIVMDVKTGEILAMANKPDFDLNEPRVITSEALKSELTANIGEALAAVGKTAEISETYLAEGGLENLTPTDAQDEEKVDVIGAARMEQLNKMWRNKTIMDTYEPGSTFKLMNVATAFELQKVTAASTFNCGGSLRVSGWGKPINCHKKSGHGLEDLTQSLMNSCNVAMMNMAFKTGGESFYEYFKALGLLEKTGIDLPGEASNQSLTFSEKELVQTPSSLAVASFGQRFQVTPIQMISMVSTLVDGGRLKTPHVVKEILDSEGNVKESVDTSVVRQVISEETSTFMRQAMQSVVSGGTGKNAYVAGYRVGGKTATSEIRTLKTDVERRYTASFIGAAPMDDPEIVVLVILYDLPESAPHGGGAIAAPVVARIMADTLPHLGVEAVYDETENDRREVSTPNVIGKTEAEAAAAFKEIGMEYKTVGDSGTITDQVPSAGAKVPITARAILYMGGTKSTQQIAVPNVNGLSPAEAQERLRAAGLYMKRTGIATKQTDGMTNAAKQSPVQGTKVGVGTVVTVEFSNSTNIGD